MNLKRIASALLLFLSYVVVFALEPVGKRIRDYCFDVINSHRLIPYKPSQRLGIYHNRYGKAVGDTVLGVVTEKAGVMAAFLAVFVRTFLAIFVAER